jgi:fumarate reductase subunit C
MSDSANITSDITTNKNPRYERFRPMKYSTRMPIFWWVRKWPYVTFILRELTSILVMAYAVILLIILGALGRGPEAYEALLAFFQTPFSIGLHVVIFAFVIYHSITWFKLAPTATVIKVGKKRLPGSALVAGNIALWIVVSAAIAWLLIG